MAIKKIALIQEISEENIISLESIRGSDKISAMFKKVADQLREAQIKSTGKQVAPKVDDFLYAHCIMMHAAEASLIDQDSGEPVRNKNGEAVKGWFENTKDAKGRDTIKWKSPDGVLPYRNQNLDIFPEEDLIKAHKEWVGRPLCKDHVSDSIDGVRGIIVDTHYDPKFKRVHALFALDRKNYGELARKVEAGYATSVSMGTAVGRSICTECSNVATVESEYCHHVRSRQCHGEINKDLNPLELSIVVTGADPKAKIMTVLASLNKYKANKTAESDLSAESSDPGEYPGFTHEDITATESDSLIVDRVIQVLSLLSRTSSEETKAKALDTINKMLSRSNSSLEDLAHDDLVRVMQAASSKGLDLGDEVVNKALEGFVEGDSTPERETIPAVESVSEETEVPVDDVKHSTGFDFGPISSASAQGAGDKKEESVMTFAKLVKEKRMKRNAYYQGTEDPTPGKTQYAPMGDQEKIRDNEDFHMNQDGDLGGQDGLAPGDEAAKKLVQRADLEGRRAMRAAWLKEAQNSVVELKDGSKALVDAQGNRMADDGKTKSAKKKDDDEDEDEDKKSKKSKSKKDEEDEDDKADKKSKSKKDDDEDEDEDKKSKKSKKDDEAEDEDDKPAKKKKKAYFQGTEDPTPGKVQYAPMGDQEKIRDNEDMQMNQDGDLGGQDGLVPGDEAAKKLIQRAGITGKLLTHASGDARKSKWIFASAGKPLFSVSAQEAYGDFLNDKFSEKSTYSDLFHSKDWGNAVRKVVATVGVKEAAKKLGIKLAAEPAAPAVDQALAPAPVEPAMPETTEPMDEAPAEDNEPQVDDFKSRVAPIVEQLETALEDLKVEVEGPDEGVDSLELDTINDQSLDVPMLPEAPQPEAGKMAKRITDKNMLEAYAAINDTANELCYIEDKYAEKVKDAKFVSLAEQALRDAQSVLKDAKAMIKAYASQKTAAKLKARTANRKKIAENAFDEQFVLDSEELDQVHDVAHKLDEEHHGGPEGLLAEKMEPEHKGLEGDAELGLDLDAGPMDELDLDQYKAMSTQARKAWRDSLIKAAKGYDDVYESVRSKGGTKLKDLDVKVEKDLDKVETLTEIHDAMVDVATKPIGKVRTAAETLDKWVKAAGFDVSAVDRLVAEGAVDPAVAKYWKEYWGKEGGEKAYADALLKDYDTHKKSASVEEHTARVRRAYAVGLEAQKKGIVENGQIALEQYVDTLVSLADTQFNQMKKHVAMYKAPQHLSVPVVGMNDKELNSTASVEPATKYQELFSIFS